MHRKWLIHLVNWLLIPAMAAGSQDLDRQLKSIFGAQDFKVRTFGPARWLDNGAAYTTVENGSIVKYETASGKRSILVSAAQLTPAGAAKPLSIDDYSWSPDGGSLLVFSAAEKVWRQNTRGDYWVLNRATGSLKKLGANAGPSSLMFAKFSPDGTRVAYVRANNIYSEDLTTGAVKALTTDGSPTIINGTTDWVYEEEFKIRDCFRWSPDGRHMAFWQFDQSGVSQFPLIDNTSSLYPKITYYPYPKAGGVNSAVRIGVVSVQGGTPTWVKVPGDPRNHYIYWMNWTPRSGELLIGQLNRLQQTMTLFLASASSGEAHPIFEDKDSAWVNVREAQRDSLPPDSLWSRDGKSLLWSSERDGWRHIYSIPITGGSLPEAGGQPQLLTTGAYDELSLDAIDREHGWMYTMASPENATQRYLYRARIDRPGVSERVTPHNLPGTHSYVLSPDCRWAFHTYSTFKTLPITDLVSIPEHRVVRVLEDNSKASAAVAKVVKPSVEFLHVPVGDGVVLDGYLIKPASFDPSKKYPVIVYVYGEPASVTVADQWGGERALFHWALASEGYLIASFDNRGTPAPKGREWRKIIYQNIGVLPAKEQTAAIRALAAERKYIDVARIGVWGWSSGGSNTLNLMFRSAETYRVGVAIAPVPDLKLYDTIYQERYLGLLEQSPQAYWTASSIHYADGLRGKLLIAHGTGDDNVHFQGTQTLINRLVELDKPFDFMEYPNRTHAISEGPGTTLHLYRLIARYFEEHLPAGPK